MVFAAKLELENDLVPGERSAICTNEFQAQYSDGPRDAEAVAVHPNGDLIVITKEYSQRLKPFGPPRIYRARNEAWQGAVEGAIVQLEFESTLDLRKINKGSYYLGQLVTGMDISTDGKRFVVMTYTHAVEFLYDLSKSFNYNLEESKDGVDFRKIKLKRRIQQEAIAYLENKPGIIYSSESPIFDPWSPFKKGILAEVTCKSN